MFLRATFSFRSNRKAPNLGTYYFKHVDTDSDMEKVEKLKTMSMEEQITEETSDDEWTFTRCDGAPKPAGKTEPVDEPDMPVKSTKLNIHKLVEKAEKLVSPAKRLNNMEAPVNKISRVKQWLNMERPDDSCDASGEDEEKESQTSEELNESIATYRAVQDYESQNFHDVSDEATPKVIMRSPKYNMKNRPWSVSCISQLAQPTIR